MNIPTSKQETLDKMYQIVRQDSWDSRDTQPISDLLDLANHSELRDGGMLKRRTMLAWHLSKVRNLKQQSAIDRHWSEIHSLVTDFATEIADATSAGDIKGGSGYQ